jgi:F-type H+-transporting ATPase subunit gamma
LAAGVRELRRRIRVVKNIQQITKAMKMVAAAKLVKAQERATKARPYAAKIEEMLRRVLAAHAPNPEGAQGQDDDTASMVEALMRPRVARKVVYAVLTSDRGFCGSYNTNMIRAAQSHIQGRQGLEYVGIVPIGRKAGDFFAKRGFSLPAKFVPAGDETSFAQARQVANELTGLFTSGTADEVNLVYSEFVNAMTYRSTVARLFPISGPDEASPSGGPAKADEAAGSAKSARTETAAEVDYIYEPSGPEVLNSLLPRYVQVRVYRALLEARASEQGARMTAMGLATDNAAEMIDKLTLDMNRARQAAITREIAEIVGGSEALK